jgi:hypothetical protein
MAKKHGGPQAAYKRDGFGGVWRWAKGHGIKRWIKARNWARRKAKQAKDPKGFKKADTAYSKKVKKLRDDKSHGDPPKNHKLVEVDNRLCAGWIARKALKPARASGIWDGYVISGYRSPEYSTSICEGICGHPTCPGLCAGASSNHSCPPSHDCKPFEGAVDVSDAAGLIAYCRSHGVPLHGAGERLPNDVNHCSHSGV